MANILNLAVPYFSLIFIGFACGKLKQLPEQGLAWMNFFLLYVSLPALLFGITSKTPFEELNNPPFLIATTCGTALAFFLAMGTGRLVGRISFRDATLAGLSGGYGNIGYMGPGLALAVLGAKTSAPTALIFCCDSIFLFSVVPLLIALTDNSDHHWLHALGLLVKQIALNPLIMSACAGALAAAFHFHPPVAIDNTLLFFAKRGGPDGTLRARRDGRATPVRPGALGSTCRGRGEAPGSSIDRLRIDALDGPVSEFLGSHGRADGVAAAGLERLCDRPAEQRLDRAGFSRGDDRDLRLRRHADRRDVAYSDRAAGVSITPLRLACDLRHDGARPSRIANRRSGPNEPISCNPAARSDCIGRNALNKERLAISMANVRLMTSGRRAEA